MLLRLMLLVTALRLRLLGARRFRRRVGEVDFLAYRIGPEDAPPWVLLHGLGASSLAWAPVLRDLRRDAHLIIPELSAIGGTRAPGGGLNPVEGAAAVAGFIAAERRGPVTLAGMSLGGWMATLVALDRPDLVARLLIVAGAGYRDQDWDRIERLVTIETRADVDRFFGALFTHTPAVFRLSRGGFLETYRSRPVRHVVETTRREHAFGAEDLARLRMPVGLVWGDSDGLFLPDTAAAMRDGLPDGELFLVPQCAHGIHWECPDALARATREFMSWSERPR